MRAVVTGPIATFPVGGVAWDYGQYLVGLERLGFEVYYLEDTGLWMFDPTVNTFVEDSEYGRAFLQRSLASLAPTVGDRWHLRTSGGVSYGIERAEIEEVVATADLFLNVSGLCLLRPAYLPSPNKVLVDSDPGWNQFVEYPRWDEGRALTYGTSSYRSHDHFFTYAVRMGRPDCPIPNLGIDWHPTRPPVVIDMWRRGAGGEVWTTVMNWNSYDEPVVYEGVEYGAKDVQFAAVEDLPGLVDVDFELAVADAAPSLVERLKDRGWGPISGTGVSRTAEEYRDYIQNSRGEFSIAKNVYVATRSGWFSCRSVCYLASSRPTVLEDTGFSDYVPAGEGLLAFRDLEGARRCIEAVEADYEAHAQAARHVAENHFASDVVLGEMLNRIELSRR